MIKNLFEFFFFKLVFSFFMFKPQKQKACIILREIIINFISFASLSVKEK